MHPIPLKFARPWQYLPGNRVALPLAADTGATLLARPSALDLRAAVTATGVAWLRPPRARLTITATGLITGALELRAGPGRLEADGIVSRLIAATAYVGPWQPAERRLADAPGRWQVGAGLMGGGRRVWQAAAGRVGGGRQVWQLGLSRQGAHAGRWQENAARIGASRLEKWQFGPARAAGFADDWAGLTAARSAEFVSNYAYQPPVAAAAVWGWQPGPALALAMDGGWRWAPGAMTGRRLPWDLGALAALWPRVVIIIPPVIPGRPVTPGNRVAIPFLGGWIRLPGDRIPIPFGAEIEPPAPGSVIVIVPTCEIVRLPDQRQIRATALALDLSDDKSSWEGRITLASDDDYDLLRGLDTEIEVRLQGYVPAWRLVVTAMQPARVFGQLTVSVTARSPSVYLGQGWAPLLTYVETQTRTAQQLAAAGLPFGWQLDWETVDYAVPGGAFSVQGQTPMDIVKAIAEPLKSMVLPHRYEDRLRVTPRHFEVSWLWGSLGSIYSIPPALVISSVFSPAERSLEANAVFLAGTQADGLRARVKRLGTAGDIVHGEELSSPLYTHADALREAGRQVLSAAGRIGVQTAQLPLMPPGQHPRLLEIGEIVEIGDTREVFRGRVSQVRIAFSFGGVPTQTVEIERFG